MKAMVLTQLGEHVQFEGADLPEGEPGPGEVRVSVRAASVNVVDTKIRAGMDAIAPTSPIVLGCDVAGVIEAVGPGAQRFSVGDEVYGCAGGVKGADGAYATSMIADERLLARKPRRLGFREAAALPLVSITAWEALFGRAKVTPGERVLVHGGAGGVGHIGVQLAKAAGTEVHATVSSQRKAEIAKSLGADRTILYRDRSVETYIDEETGGDGYDVVFDTVGGANIAPSLEAVGLNGRVASIVSLETAPDLSALHLKNASLHVVFMLIPLLTGRGRAAHGRILERVATLVDLGAVRPLLDESRFSLDEVGEAHERLVSGGAIGKVVLEVAA